LAEHHGSVSKGLMMMFVAAHMSLISWQPQQQLINLQTLPQFVLDALW